MSEPRPEPSNAPNPASAQPARQRKQNLALLGGALGAALVFALCALADLPRDACWTAAITTLCAVYWVTEAISIPATSLIPFAAFPLCGVMSHKEVAKAYGHYLILLLLGGFVLSKAIESSGVHRRLALGMVRACGRFGRRGLVLGFMIATALSSMWISNTATVLMLLPIVLAVIADDPDGGLEVPLLLGIAYAASIGGIGTPIGTPPNVLFMSVYEDLTQQRVSFVEWMTWGVPIVVLFVPIAWWTLTRGLHGAPRADLPRFGTWRAPERRVLILFAATALAWVFRTHPGGGWTEWFGMVDAAGVPTIGDETIAIAAVSLCFLLPNGEGARLLEWERARELPWGLLLLFAGGLAIANAFESSGLSGHLGAALAKVADGPTLLVIGIICLFVTFATEITSNTATTSLLMPILGAAAIGASIDPRLLMVPAAISASCAFMMPVATVPNAIVFGTDRVPIRTMVRRGLVLNFIGVVVITAVCAAVL